MPLSLFVDWPAPESWKWLGLTAAVMFGYYALLVRFYGAGVVSVVYPLARGLAPVLTTSPRSWRSARR